MLGLCAALRQLHWFIPCAPVRHSPSAWARARQARMATARKVACSKAVRRAAGAAAAQQQPAAGEQSEGSASQARRARLGARPLQHAKWVINAELCLLLGPLGRWASRAAHLERHCASCGEGSGAESIRANEIVRNGHVQAFKADRASIIIAGCRWLPFNRSHQNHKATLCTPTKHLDFTHRRQQGHQQQQHDWRAAGVPLTAPVPHQPHNTTTHLHMPCALLLLQCAAACAGCMAQTSSRPCYSSRSPAW